MVFPDSLEPDCQGLAKNVLGLGVFRLRLQAGRKVVVAGGSTGVVFAQRLLRDGQGLAVEGLRLGVLCLRPQVGCDILAARGDTGVAVSPRLEPDGQGLTEQGLGLGVLPLRVQARRHVVVGLGRIGVVIPQPFPASLEHAAVDSFGLPVASRRYSASAFWTRPFTDAMAFLPSSGMAAIAQIIDGAAGIGRLPVVHALEPGPDLSHLPGRLDGLRELILRFKPSDLLLQLRDLGGGLAAELAFPLRDNLIRAEVRSVRRGPDQCEIRSQRPAPRG